MSNKPTLKIVPVEPTEEMKHSRSAFFGGRSPSDVREFIADWKAAVQAAPPAPSVEEAKNLIAHLRNGTASRVMLKRCDDWLAQFEAMESREDK